MEFREIIVLEKQFKAMEKQVRYKVLTDDNGITNGIGPLTSGLIPNALLRREITSFGIGEYEFNSSKYSVMHVELRIPLPGDRNAKSEERKMSDAELCLLASGRVY